MPDSELDILAVDTVVGDDGQMPGISQPVTLDEIRDVIYATDPVAVRLEKLRHMRADFQTRNAADMETGFDAYIAEIDRGISELTGEAEGFITPESLDEFDDPQDQPTETSAVDDPDPATTRTASGSVSSPVDLDAGETPDGAPTTNPASRIA